LNDLNEVTGEVGWLVGIIEGEGSLYINGDSRPGRAESARFSIEMTDEDVIRRAGEVFQSWDIDVKVRPVASRGIGRDGTPWKPTWVIQIGKASYLKIIIDKCYDYFSEKKQGDCDRILKNLADRGLL
jgi:hypothetical protein